MLSKMYKYIIAGLAIISGVLTLLLGIQTNRNKKLKAEANGAVAVAEKAEEQLKTATEAVKAAEEKRQEVLQTEATIDSIKTETAAAVETAKKIEVGDTVTLGKWIMVFAILFTASACVPSLTECRASYPCPGNACVKVTPPTLAIVPRPELTQVTVSVNAESETYILTKEQISALVRNERALIETVNGYEKIIAVYNEWRVKQ